MQKTELLKELALALGDGRLTKDDVLGLIHQSSSPTEAPKKSRKVDVGRVFAYIGGGIVYLSIAIFIAQNWEALDPAMRLLVTLGVGIAAFLSAILLSRDERSKDIAPALHIIAALTLPVGFFVAFYTAGFDIFTSGTTAIVAALAFLMYAGSALVLRTPLLTFFATLFGTWLYFAAGSYISDNSSVFSGVDYFMYLLLGAGLAYCLLGYMWPRLRGFLYAAGIASILTSTLILGGWQPLNYAWELAYPVILAATLWLSVYLRSQAFLVFGSLFTVAFILKMTGEYFAEVIGWPFALAGIGIAMILISFLAINLRKRFK